MESARTERPIRHTLSHPGGVRSAPKARSRPDLRPDETARLALPGERDSSKSWLFALAILFIAASWWLVLR